MDPFWNLEPAFQPDLASAVGPDPVNEAYLQDFQGSKGGVLERDNNNLGPRLSRRMGRLRGTGRSIVRGGWGIFYDFPYTNATIVFPATAVQSGYRRRGTT